MDRSSSSVAVRMRCGSASISLDLLGEYPKSCQQPLQLFGDVTILAPHDLRAGLDNGHAAAETAIGLGHFQADITTAEHDEMRRQDVELQNLNMGKGPDCLKTGNARDCGMRADIDDDLAADQHALAALVQGNFHCFRRDETSASHDELGTAGLIGVEVEGDIAVEFGGRVVHSVEDLKGELFEKSQGTEVELVVLRNEEEVRLKIKLGKRKDF